MQDRLRKFCRKLPRLIEGSDDWSKPTVRIYRIYGVRYFPIAIRQDLKLHWTGSYLYDHKYRLIFNKWMVR